MNNNILKKELPSPKTRYELKNVVCDYGIFEDGEMILLLNDYMNAEYILNILRCDEKKKRYPNMVTMDRSFKGRDGRLLK